MSSTEAELIAMSKAMSELLWLRRIVADVSERIWTGLQQPH